VPGLREKLIAYMGGRGEPPPIAQTLGMKLTKFTTGKATMTMKVDRKFHNPMGTLHGGIMTDLADAAMGIATISTLSEDEAFTTLELKMNFLRPVYNGKITADGLVLHRGATIALVEATVKDDGGKMVARGVATQMILRMDKKLPASRAQGRKGTP
jgi:uncharacterized protein (TIGR00369 family)